MEMKNIRKWCDTNKQSLNLEKIKFFVFAREKKKNPKIQLVIDQYDIIQVDQIKFVGVIWVSKMNWKQHIRYICLKLARTESIMDKLSHIINQKALYILYCALVVPY